MNNTTRYVRKFVRGRGFDLIHYAPWKNLFETFRIDLILDVGANSGQTYDAFRWAGFDGPICSLGPQRTGRALNIGSDCWSNVWLSVRLN
jgi:hypothetical protein